MDDMDELLESRLKKPNQSQRRDGHDPTIAKALSGQVATQLRKKLNGSYHLFKMKLLSEGSPVISKEEWFKAHRTDLLPNYLELEQANQYRVSMTYIHQRLRLLSDQRMKGIARIKDFRNVIYSGKTYLMIREAEIATTDKDVIDLTETPPKYTFQSTTKAQLSRVNIQCFAVLNMMQQIEVKIDSEMTMLQGFLSDVSNTSDCELMIKKREDMKKKFRAENTMCIISEKVRDLTGSVISCKKLREWYNEYLSKKT